MTSKTSSIIRNMAREMGVHPNEMANAIYEGRVVLDRNGNLRIRKS